MQNILIQTQLILLLKELEAQVQETNDDKANLEPTPLNQVPGDLGG